MISGQESLFNGMEMTTKLSVSSVEYAESLAIAYGWSVKHYREAYHDSVWGHMDPDRIAVPKRVLEPAVRCMD